MKKILTLILALSLLLSLGTTAFAAEVTTKQAELYYREIKILIDGKELIPQDVNGESTEPFIIEGTTYLPVRAVASALGLKVEWNGKTNTISLSSGGQINYGSGESVGTKRIVSATIGYRDIRILLDGKALSLTDVNGQTVEPFIMGGTTYVPVRAISSALGLEVDWNAAMNTVILSTGKAWLPKSLSRSTTTSYDGKTVKQTVEYSYDAAGRPLSIRVSSPQRSYTAAVTYDKSGRITRLSVSGLGISWGYEHKYDESGRLIYEKDWDGKDYIECSYVYYKNDLVAVMTRTSRTNGVVDKIEYRYSYDTEGRLLTESYTHGQAENSTVYSYDDQGRLLETVSTDAQHTLKDVYSYNSRGLLVSLEKYDCGTPFGSYSYEYDSRDRLIRESYSYKGYSTLDEYEYDDAGRVTLHSYSDSRGNSTVTSTEYDKYGNVCRQRLEETSPDHSYSEENVYEYNSVGDLLLRQREDSNGSSYSFTGEYDGLGRVIGSTSATNGNETRYNAVFDLGKWPVRTVSTGIGSLEITEVEYSVFPSDLGYELLEDIHRLLEEHIW